MKNDRDWNILAQHEQGPTKRAYFKSWEVARLFARKTREATGFNVSIHASVHDFTMRGYIVRW